MYGFAYCVTKPRKRFWRVSRVPAKLSAKSRCPHSTATYHSALTPMVSKILVSMPYYHSYETRANAQRPYRGPHIYNATSIQLPSMVGHGRNGTSHVLILSNISCQVRTKPSSSCCYNCLMSGHFVSTIPRSPLASIPVFSPTLTLQLLGFSSMKSLKRLSLLSEGLLPWPFSI